MMEEGFDTLKQNLSTKFSKASGSSSKGMDQLPRVPSNTQIEAGTTCM